MDQHFAPRTVNLGVLLEVLSAQLFPLSLNLSLVVRNLIHFIYYVAAADPEAFICCVIKMCFKNQ